MTRSHGMTPPLTPVLLAGLAVRPLPPSLLQPFLNMAMTALQRRHPDIFERLSGLDAPLFLVDPVDLPFVFLLDPDPLMPSLKAVRDPGDAPVTATIRGPLLTLLELLEGRTDGDALFFSRDLVIEGDTEAVVALRNAVDGAEVDVLDDLLSALGPFAGPARRAAQGALGLLGRAQRDLDTLRAAVIAPAMRRSEAQAAELRRLEERVQAAGGRQRRSRAGAP